MKAGRDPEPAFSYDQPMKATATKSILETAIGIALLVSSATGPAVAQDAVRMAMEAFDTEAQIEVRGMNPSQADPAVRAALTEIHAIQRLLDPSAAEGFGVAFLEANAGKWTTVDPRLGELLTRSRQYCLWSSGSFSPLGGEIEQLWRLRDQTGVGPDPSALRRAVQRAECERLEVESGASTRVRIPEGSKLATSSIEKGFAIDKAIDTLLRHGVTNAFVEIGHVVRSIGGGPDNKGWLVAVPGHRKTRDPLDQFWLTNHSLAVAREDGTHRRLDHRKGVPSIGVVQIAAVSELAIDTEVLAHLLYVVGSPEGQRLLGYLNPRPSVFWLLGNDVGTPLESQYHWSELSRPRKPSF